MFLFTLQIYCTPLWWFLLPRKEFLAIKKKTSIVKPTPSKCHSKSKNKKIWYSLQVLRFELRVRFALNSKVLITSFDRNNRHFSNFTFSFNFIRSDRKSRLKTIILKTHEQPGYSTLCQNRSNYCFLHNQM